MHDTGDQSVTRDLTPDERTGCELLASAVDRFGLLPKAIAQEIGLHVSTITKVLAAQSPPGATLVKHVVRVTDDDALRAWMIAADIKPHQRRADDLQNALHRFGVFIHAIKTNAPPDKIRVVAHAASACIHALTPAPAPPPAGSAERLDVVA